MPFKTPKSVPPLPFDPPDSIPVAEFVLGDRQYNQPACQFSRPSFVCGVTGRSFSQTSLRHRVESLSKGLSQRLGWHPNDGTEWDKVVGIYSLNAIDYMTVAWATHRLGGIVTPISSAYSVDEVTEQLRSSGARVLFTCASLLSRASDAARAVGFASSSIFLIDLAGEDRPGATPSRDQAETVDDLVSLGERSPDLEPLQWGPGQAAKQVAFLCYSSGTSGLPKGVMISHKNVIANVLQLGVYEQSQRQDKFRDVALGVLPQNHIYALVVICHASVYRGDQVVILPRYDFKRMLQVIDKFSIRTLYLVPSILLDLLRYHDELNNYSLKSVVNIMTGASSLSTESWNRLQRRYPQWTLRQGYGLTECATVVSSTHKDDIVDGSSGYLIPGVECRLVTPDGLDIETYNVSGELLVRSPSVALGYLNNDKATKDTFQDGWLRTGDEAMFKLGPRGSEHIVIVDRIKELIKVNGIQVSPTELEAQLYEHPAVAEAVVVPIYDERAGEVPKAFVVRHSPSANNKDADLLKESLMSLVRAKKAKYKWLRGGVEFVDALPKNSTGKILRRKLRDEARRSDRRDGAKM
ncbi:hypothetical protein BJY01DRAFT_262403 [Aspergillus pseudoustus]|uniref:Phenylacetyl-CoA ligase n=1 Tax=Aspergillus pseudoustus TaxID=1810923 RepID=A0ABR4K996_9EURO